jgi:hypothetical protein
MNAIEKASKSLRLLSDAQWLQVKDAEDGRRADQRAIRDPAVRYRKLHNQDLEPARLPPGRRHRGGAA